MSIKDFIFGKVNNKPQIYADETKVITPTANSTSSNAEQNPFVKGSEGRREWNDRYMNMAKSIRNWQIAFIALAAISFVQAMILIILVTQSKVVPYVVETSHGIPYNIKSVSGISDKDQLLVNYEINQFVINAKSIIADTQAEKSLLDNVYAYSAGSTFGFLQEFYAKQNPFDLAGSFTVSVNIINSLSVGKGAWQVTWEETKHDINSGNPIETTKWIGHFNYQFGQVSPKNFTKNPFGIYITNVNWSQSQ